MWTKFLAKHICEGVLFQWSSEKCHKYPKIEDFIVIGKGYRNNTFKPKVAEFLLIQDVRPTLSTHEKSVPLKLFNWYDVCLFPLPCE